MPHRAALIVAAAAQLLGAESANGAVVTRLDRAGRPMTFDVRARGVNVNWYAGRLRGSIHGDEISDVVVRIVLLASSRGSAGAAAVVTRLGAARTC